MPRLAANYYHMPKKQNAFYLRSASFSTRLKIMKRVSLNYYQQAQQYVGEQFGLFYNIALCEHHLAKHADALVHFKQALTLDPASKETEEWITFTEKALLEDKE